LSFSQSINAFSVLTWREANSLLVLPSRERKVEVASSDASTERKVGDEADIAAQSTIMIGTGVPMDFSCCDLLNDYARPKMLS
jgi:hypothetical protein